MSVSTDCSTSCPLPFSTFSLLMNLFTLLSVALVIPWVEILGVPGFKSCRFSDGHGGLRLLLLEDPGSRKVDRRRRPNRSMMLSCFCLSSRMSRVMTMLRMTITVVIITDTQLSTIAQYVDQTGAAPDPSGRVSTIVPTSRARAQMIIAMERHIITARENFRENGIIDSLRITMGKVITRNRGQHRGFNVGMHENHVLRASHAMSMIATRILPTRLLTCWCGLALHLAVKSWHQPPRAQPEVLDKLT